MFPSFLSRWLQPKSRTPVSRRPRFARPRLEALEDRTLLATFTVNTLADTGAGSLRQAITDANSVADDDTIGFQAGLTGTIQLGSALPNLSTNIAIVGPGASVLTVRRNTGGNYRLFTIPFFGPPHTTSISGLTLTNGLDSTASGGGAIFNGRNNRLTITSCTIFGNSASGSVGDGGGIYTDTDSDLTITNSTISGNTATTSNGGGIRQQFGSSLTITSSTISGNTAGFQGGGIFKPGSSTLTINSSTISGNSASNSGGGIRNGGSLSITRSTISGNSGSLGGGIDSSIFFSIGNTIVAGNIGPNPDINLTGGFTVDSQGNNLIGNFSGSSGWVASDLLNVNPLLGPLQFNDGPTLTHALLPGSPAIDAGNNSGAPAFDQRGLPRIAHGTVDIGAFEVQPQLYLVTNTNDSGVGSLRQALISANSAGGISDIILATAGTIQLAGALPNISANVDIRGPGANVLTVRRNTGGDYGLFTINPGVTASISGLTLTNGFSSNGGAILNFGTLTITSSTISGNSASNGGGGILNAGGTMTITSSTISGNSASFAGGIDTGGNGTLTITSSTISGNTASSSGGGGIFTNDGTLTITRSTISGNTASSSGGGIMRDFAGSISIGNTIVAGNSAPTGPDVSASAGLTSQGNNLIGNPSGSSGFGAAGDLLNVNPLLGPLQNNGGPTSTHALLAGSPAIDAGNNTGAPAFDQRGFTRIVNTAVDIGAFEVQDIRVTTLADSGAGSLRQAITDANSRAGDHIIVFQAGLTGIIQLSTALPDLSTNIVVNGPGANVLTVRRNTGGDYRLFTINSGVTASISGLTLTNGSGFNGGGIVNGGTLTITSSTISGNTASSIGGAIDNVGTLTITSSTISGNSATNFGGGIYSAGTATLTVSNSTLSGNSASYGGGIINNASTATVTVSNSTLSGNSASTSGGGIYNAGTATLNNSLVANSPSGGDVVGTVTGSNNLFGTVALGPLQDNGGPTLTHALLPGSPAIDAGANAGVPGAFDQRGLLRIVNNLIDIGAFEVQQYLVTSTADSGAGSLRTALTNTNSLGGGIIAFATAGTIQLGAALPDISKPVDIRGPGANVLTVRRNTGGNYRLFTINSGVTASISGLTLTNGSVGSGFSGGGISNEGTLTITSSTISGNSASGGSTLGGGIFNTGTLTITSSTISGNSASFLGGGLFSNGTLTITSSTIAGNSANGGGGIENNFGTLTITSSTISGNSANAGGGIDSTGTLTITSSTISGNSANIEGGGIRHNAGSVSIGNTIVAGNTAPNGPDVNGPVTSQGNNLIGNPSGSSGFGASGDLLNVNPLLGPLQFNGGPTRTHALLFGSPAIDAGNSSGAPAFDQRGSTFPRIVNGTVDIGAVEFGNGPALRSIPRTAYTLMPGQTLTLSNVAFTGRQAPHTATVDWGDGSTLSTFFLAEGVQTFSPSHVYSVGGSFAITLTVTADDQSGSDSVRLGAAVGTPLPPANLVSWWTGDGNPTLSAPDIAGANPGTLNGRVGYVAGQVGQALDFDPGEFVRVENHPTLLPQQFTLSAWVRPTATGVYAGLVSKEGAGASSEDGYGFRQRADNNRFWFVLGREGLNPRAESTTVISAGTWYHLAGTYDGTNMRFYVNGVLEATANVPGRTINSTTPLYLGRLPSGMEPYQGQMDEVQLYNRVLSAAEVQQMVNAGSLGLVKGVFVGANTPQVQTLTPTNTGFGVLFNRAIDPSMLNLYDTQTGGLGAADVTLVGSTTGAVRGSLVLNATNTGFTFVRTGGVLPADTYTVTLRSAANGFKDTLGALLDGDANGTAGGNYTAMFTVAASSSNIVSIPDLTRGPGQTVNIPANTTNGIPLRLSNPVGVDSVDVTIRYDPALLTITNAVRGPNTPTDAEVTVNLTTAGVAIIAFSSATPLSANAADFVLLTASVPSGTPTLNRYTGKQVLDLSNVLVNEVAARDDDGLHINAYFGDTNANGSYSSLDAQRALRVVVGLDGGFAFYPLGDPAVVADITGNGTLTSADATRLLQKVVGLEPGASLVPSIPGGIVIPQPPGRDPLLHFPRRFQARPGERVTVPLLLDQSQELVSADLAISYDAARLEVVEVRRGGLTGDFDLFLTNVDPAAGTIRVGLARTAGPIEDRGAGAVLEIVFRVKPNAPRGPAIVNLRENLEPTRTQLNEGGLDLVPDPSNRAGDRLDGWIVVLEQRRVRDLVFAAGLRAPEERDVFRALLVGALAPRKRPANPASEGR